MTVQQLKAFLEDQNPNAQVRLHSIGGHPVMFAVRSEKNKDEIWLEDRTDFDVVNELKAQYEHAAETQRDELEFFEEMLDVGFTIEDFEKALTSDQFAYAKTFMEEHGLL